MSIEERIELFWERVRKLRIDGSQIALWFGLLHIFWKNGFPAFFEIENEFLCGLLGWNIKTLRAVRKRLIRNKLIGYEAGNARRQPTYSIDIDGKELEKVEKQKPRRKVKKVETSQPLLFELEDENKKANKPKEPQHPTINEVIDLFKRNGKSEEKAKKFFYYYDAQGWITTGGQKIKRIDSMVNRWIMNEDDKEHGDGNEKNLTRRDKRNKEVIDDIMSRYS